MAAIRTGLAAWVPARGDSPSSMLRAVTPLATPYLMLIAIGVELALQTAFLPDTLDRFLHGPPADFHNLYRVAAQREVPGLYSPFLVVLLYPLTVLSEMAAFRAFFLINVACVVGISLIAQRGVRSFEAKSAVALAPLALPQVHWALRLGHLTPIIALTALAALVLLRAHPRRGAILLGVLSLKPQYLIAPMAYLACKREWRLIAIVIATAAALAMLGFAVIGPHGVPTFINYYLDWGPDSGDNLLPVQQSWMISWPGVQISAFGNANPILTLELIVVSLAVAGVAWLRLNELRALAVVALMFIPLTPYAQFYDGALVLVAIAMLLRADIPDAVKAATCGLLYLAAIVTQANVVFPVKDVLGPAFTHGFYWLAPLLVAFAAALAIFGVPRFPKEAA